MGLEVEVRRRAERVARVSDEADDVSGLNPRPVSRER
jgi:hypothetical protein